MTSITQDEVRKLAQMSAISLSDDEETTLQSDISNILEYVDQLKQLDTKDVEPTYQLSGLTNVFRSDEIEAGLSRDQLLALAEDTKNNHIKVPKVL